MSNASLIRKNSFLSFLSSATRLVANIVLFVGIARLYDPRIFGQFTAAHTYFTLFLLIADFGFDLLALTEISRDREKRNEIIRKLFPVKVILSLLAVVSMVFLTFLIPGQEGIRGLMLIFAVGIVANAFTNFFFFSLRALEQFKYEVWITLVQNAFLLAGMIVSWHFGATVASIAAVFVISRYLGLLLVVYVCMKYYSLRGLAFNFIGLRSALGAGMTFGLHLLFGTLYFQLDTLMLMWLRGDYDVGIYQSVFKIVILVLMVPDILTSAVIPVLSGAFDGEPERWRRVGRLLTKVLIYLGLPLGLLCFTYAAEIIDLVYGLDNFHAAVPVLKLFAITVMVRYGAESFAVMLTTSRNQNKRTIIVIIATVLNGALNLYAIPAFGVVGAASVSLATNLFAAIAYIAVVRSKIPAVVSGIDRRVWIMIAGTFLLAVFYRLLNANFLLLALPLTAIVYPLVYYFIGFSTSERSAVFALSAARTE